MTVTVIVTVTVTVTVPCSYLSIYEAQYCIYEAEAQYCTYLRGRGTVLYNLPGKGTDNLRKPKTNTNTRSYAKAGRISPLVGFLFFLILVLVLPLSLPLARLSALGYYRIG